MEQQDKRQMIMQAAEKLFTTRRFHEITLEEVACEAKVGKGTIYRYFQDKDDLFFQTAHWGMDELCELIRSKVPATDCFSSQLVDVCRLTTDFFERRRESFRMMQAQEDHVGLSTGPLYDRWLEHRKALVAAVAAVVQKGMDEGVLRPDVPADVQANFLMGMLRTRTRDLREAEAKYRSHQMVVEMFLHGAAGRQAK